MERVVALLGRRGEAGDAAIQAGQAGAAVGQAGQGRHGGDADIPPLSRADLPQGRKPLAVFLAKRSLKNNPFLSRSRSRSSTPAGIPRRSTGALGVKREGAQQRKNTATLQKRLQGLSQGKTADSDKKRRYE